MLSSLKMLSLTPRRKVLGTLMGCLLTGATVAQAQPSAKPRDIEASPRLRAKVSDLIDEISESEAELEITYRRSKLVRTKLDIVRAAVADPSIIEIVPYGTREVELIGKGTGSTTLTIWLGNAQQTRILSLLVTVVHDTGVDDRRRMEYGELQQMINEFFPNSKIQLIPVADKLIVRGEARDAEEATQIMSILRKNTGGGGGLGGVGFGAGIAQGPAAEPFPDASTLPQSTIISLLNVPGEQQVLLKVRIAELKRSALRRLGAKFNFTVEDFALASLVGGSGSFIASQTFDEGSFTLFVDALATNGVARILAEPNLVTLSGRPATFLAGGEFAVPTVVGVGGVQAVSTTFKGFGTSLAFTPTVLDKDRIRLQVVPTFSTLNRDNAVQGIFGLDTRTTSTTVDMREGQTFAIAGLIQEQMRGDKTRVPFIGDLPVVGVLFSSQNTSKDETELLVLVTPELVHPMEPDTVPQLVPGIDVTEPDDIEFFLYRRIEGDPNCHHRSTVWYNYRDRNCYGSPCGRAAQSSNYYLAGPQGYSE